MINQMDPIIAQSHRCWWIDVGLEINSKKDEGCLAWRTDSHYQADRLTTPGSSKYTRDMASHLTEVSGCRIAPGFVSNTALSVRYFQAYTTDKSHTYRIDQGRYGKFITCDRILKGKDKDYLEGVYRLY